MIYDGRNGKKDAPGESFWSSNRLCCSQAICAVERGNRQPGGGEKSLPRHLDGGTKREMKERSVFDAECCDRSPEPIHTAYAETREAFMSATSHKEPVGIVLGLQAASSGWLCLNVWAPRSPRTSALRSMQPRLRFNGRQVHRLCQEDSGYSSRSSQCGF